MSDPGRADSPSWLLPAPPPPGAPESAPRRLRGFSFCLGLSLAACLLTFSNLAQPFFPIFLASVALLGVGVTWAVLLLIALVRRRRPETVLLAAPVVVVLVAVLSWTGAPTKARWVVTEPWFDAIVKEAGPPPIEGTEPQTDDDEEAGWADLEPCPSVIGSYLIRECSAFPGGYLFFDSAGSGMIDDGGIAYLPYGVPEHAGTGWFESPDFVHLHGDWYTFASSW